MVTRFSLIVTDAEQSHSGCYQEAAHCVQQAEAQNDPKVKQQFLELTPRWLLLARGYVVNKSSVDPAQIAKNNSYPDRDVAI
jgi:hypothetical protein